MGRGHWKGDSEFIVESFLLGDARRFVDTFSFQGDKLVWRQEAPTYGYSLRIKGLMKQ
jgi:hypothetical protein